MLTTMLAFMFCAYDKIGIMSAMEVELALISDHMHIERVDTVSRRVFLSGRLGDVSCVLVQAGVGEINAAITAEILITKFDIDAIIFSGVAGGINPKLGVGDIIISDKVLHHDYGQIIPTMFEPWDTVGFAADTFLVRLAQTKASTMHFESVPEKICKEVNHMPQVTVGRVATGDQFIASEEKRQWLEKTFRVDCVEMEGAAVGQVCAINKIPFLIIRCLSDLANEKAAIDFEAFVEYAAKNSSMLVVEIIDMLKKR